ncbi:hypothetical protein [Halarchaeum sp. P4]|uniref:hypothetical protein n=1 Tax=Halarchaeum sp. P4 TaxID=3421639 RepID=UPI003EC0A0C0
MSDGHPLADLAVDDAHPVEDLPALDALRYAVWNNFWAVALQTLLCVLSLCLLLGGLAVVAVAATASVSLGLTAAVSLGGVLVLGGFGGLSLALPRRHRL